MSRKSDPFDVQHDFGYVFDDPRNRRKLVVHTLNLEFGHCRTLNRRQQHAPQRIPQRMAIPWLKWFNLKATVVFFRR
jgi:hypothetical protein